MVGVEGLVTSLCDQFPWLKATERRRLIFVSSLCVLQFLVGLPMVTNGGAKKAIPIKAHDIVIYERESRKNCHYICACNDRLHVLALSHKRA